MLRSAIARSGTRSRFGEPRNSPTAPWAGAVLVLRGEPGIGKTALVDHVVASTSGVRVLRTVGVESEMELPFAALHQLCSPVLDRLDRLPDPQRAALATVFGLSANVPPTGSLSASPP